MHAVDALPHNVESGQAAVLSGVVEQGVHFPKDETHFRRMHHATSHTCSGWSCIISVEPAPRGAVFKRLSTDVVRINDAKLTAVCISQAYLLGYTPSPQQAFQGDAAHQVQRGTWLTPNDSPGTWYTRRDYWSWTIRPFHRTVFTAHTWISLPCSQLASVN